MAEEFHTGIYSNETWWNTLRSTTTFDRSPSITCSTTAIRDIGDGSSSWSQTIMPYYRQGVMPSFELDQTQTGFASTPDNPLKDMSQAFLPGLFEPEPLKDMNDSVQAPWAKFSPQLFKVSSPPKQQLQFSNSTTFWNPSANPEPAPHLIEPRFEADASCSNHPIMKPQVTKKNGCEPAMKKPRIQTPSPLPTFKVRKEKLGDRVTALQQLVSPFGKTDTASVLYEAIEYIKFLHGQVGALTTPYLENGHQIQHRKILERSTDDEEGPKQDLRSRGLCLVPISSTFAVASEPMDFWTPTFGGSYR